MSNRGFRPIATIAMVVAVFSLALVPVASQTYSADMTPLPGAKAWLLERAKLPPFDPPRTSNGRPNLQGYWRDAGANDDIEGTPYMDATTPATESRVSDPPDGKIPYQPWAAAKRQELRAGLGQGWPGERERLYVTPNALCLLGVARWTNRGNFKLLQNSAYVTILIDWGHYYRIIPLDGRPHVGEQTKQWMGNSRGRWEGDTLVVDVTNLNAKDWLDSDGANFHSDAMHMVERWTLVNSNIINYEITIDDPRVYSRPWKQTYPIRRHPDQKEEIWEHACYEGNSHTLEGTKSLGFKFFPGIVAPK